MVVVVVGGGVDAASSVDDWPSKTKLPSITDPLLSHVIVNKGRALTYPT